MEDELVAEVLALHRAGRWRRIVDEYHDHPHRNRLLWVFPSPENFRFLHTALTGLGCDKILSVGCGSGLLEWLITESTGIPVTGVEVDGAWWGSRHAPPPLAPRLLTAPAALAGPVRRALADTSTALLFCYFNNRHAFGRYLRSFAGPALVVVGPGPGRGAHSDPSPFDAAAPGWQPLHSREVRDSGDYIAIYVRSHS